MDQIHKQNGFTLVELAIALMVIGLLIGGVLKGQELIENARVTATIRQIKAYDTAAMIFRNTYNALPGDIKRPNRIPNCTEEICTIAGNGSGKIRYEDTDPRNMEVFNFFPHMTKAGMIQGPEGGALAEIMPDHDLVLVRLPIQTDVPVYVEYQTADTEDNNGFYDRAAGHYYWLYGISGAQGFALDSKMDDGYFHTGSVIAVEDSSQCFDTDEHEYIQNASGCGMQIRAEF